MRRHESYRVPCFFDILVIVSRELLATEEATLNTLKTVFQNNAGHTKFKILKSKCIPGKDQNRFGPIILMLLHLI